jgi:IS605 OrfB family transposase
MAQSVLKTVIARYKTILETESKWIKPSFKKPQYDLVWNRDYSLTGEYFSVNTLSGRIKLTYHSEGMEKYFDHTIYKFGTAKLVNKHGKYYLHIPVTYDVEEFDSSKATNVVGIDRGINFVVATYDSKHKSCFVNGRAIKQKRSNYSKLRKELQMRRTPSSRRRIKAIGQRENRWMQDVNHCISKALVDNNPKHTLFVLEDLSGVRNATERARTKDRYVSVSWSFYDLEQKLIYKARQNQSTVIKVNPRYTSQCCPMCGHIERSNRDKRLHLFCCKNCGYKSNDDRIGAMNLHRMGINYLEDSQVPNAVTTE